MYTYTFDQVLENLTIFILIFILNYDRPAVILRHPKKNDLTNQFFKPFSREVWVFTTLVAFINWFLLYLITKINQHYDKKESLVTLDTIPASECAIITTAAVCQQGALFS